MAPLTAPEFRDMRVFIYRLTHGKDELKAETPTLISRNQLRAAFQAIEDRWDAQRPGFKADLDAALGFVTTPTLARKFMRAWMNSKLNRGG